MTKKLCEWQGEQSSRERIALDRWGYGSTHRRIDPEARARYASAGSHYRPEPGHLGTWIALAIVVVLGALAWLR